jgi:putative nucleotidyltransferase with HDIG domain
VFKAETVAEMAAPRPFAVFENERRISLPEILSALSFALDLAEGAAPGHALRSCILGMRVAGELGMSDAERRSLYYALLLKDAGSSSNASRIYQITGGDDREIKRRARLEGWPRLSSGMLGSSWKNVVPGSNPIRKTLRIAQIGIHRYRNHEVMIRLRADRGARMALKIGVEEAAASAIRHLDERWDGRGYPDSLEADKIPLASRIMAVAQHLDVFSGERGPHAALRTLREHSGRWFDPELVRVALSLDEDGDLWFDYGPEEARREVLDLAPHEGDATESQADKICEAFAGVVDAKSSFTGRHSIGVTHAALKIAFELNLPHERRKLVWRAALLHDLGKLAVSNAILDKPSQLDAGAWAEVRRHPLHTRKILERIGPFAELAEVASQHHERLDGTGYPHGLTADQLSIEARILAVADVYAALSEERPYRAALNDEEAFSVIKKDVPHRVDAACFEALRGEMRAGDRE